MVFRVSEYGGFLSGRPFAIGIPEGGPIQTQSCIATTTGPSTIQLSSATHMILVDTDVGSYMTIGSSVSTFTASSGSSVSTGSFGGGLGSTNSTNPGSQRIPANVAPLPFYVFPYSKVTVLST